MQRLISAIDKGVSAGLHTLEETAVILQAIDQVGAIVSQYNKAVEAQKEQEEAMNAPDPNLAPEGKMEVVKGSKK